MAVGSVTVNYVINASGGVESPQIEASSGYPEMDAAALAAIVIIAALVVLAEGALP